MPICPAMRPGYPKPRPAAVCEQRERAKRVRHRKQESCGESASDIRKRRFYKNCEASQNRCKAADAALQLVFYDFVCLWSRAEYFPYSKVAAMRQIPESEIPGKPGCASLTFRQDVAVCFLPEPGTSKKPPFRPCAGRKRRFSFCFGNWE